MRNIRVAVWGFGAMGSGITKVLLHKTGVEITGVCDCIQLASARAFFRCSNVPRGATAEKTSLVCRATSTKRCQKKARTSASSRPTRLRKTCFRSSSPCFRAGSTRSAPRRR